MSTQVICKVISPEGEHARLQEEITRHESRSVSHDRFHEHYSSLDPIQLQATLKAYAADLARIEYRNRILEKQNENLLRALKGHRGVIAELEAKIKQTDWASLA